MHIMELENYFDFGKQGEIRLKGHRINLEHVLRLYLEGAGPEEFVYDFPSLNLEEVHATILYYLANKEKIEEYLRGKESEAGIAYQKWLSKSDPKTKALREKLLNTRKELLTKKDLISSI